MFEALTLLLLEEDAEREDITSTCGRRKDTQDSGILQGMKFPRIRAQRAHDFTRTLKRMAPAADWQMRRLMRGEPMARASPVQEKLPLR